MTTASILDIFSSARRVRSVASPRSTIASSKCDDKYWHRSLLLSTIFTLIPKSRSILPKKNAVFPPPRSITLFMLPLFTCLSSFAVIVCICSVSPTINSSSPSEITVSDFGIITLPPFLDMAARIILPSMSLILDTGVPDSIFAFAVLMLHMDTLPAKNTAVVAVYFFARYL